MIQRRLTKLSDPRAVLNTAEYFKGCYGLTEYPEDMHGIRLSVEGETPRSLEYAYHSRKISSAGASAVSVRIPQINTEIRLEALGSPAACGLAVEGLSIQPVLYAHPRKEDGVRGGDTDMSADRRNQVKLRCPVCFGREGPFP